MFDPIATFSEFLFKIALDNVLSPLLDSAELSLAYMSKRDVFHPSHSPSGAVTPI